MTEEFADTEVDEDNASLKTAPPELLNQIGGREIL